MGHKGVKIAGIIALTGLAGCIDLAPAPQGDPPAPLNGKAYLGGPLDNAEITVETASGDPVELASEGTTSQGRFFEKLSLAFPLSQVSSYLPLTVKVTGGTVDGNPFDGTLLGYASSFSSDDNVHANILTTLIVKYKRVAGVSFAKAEQAVVAALRIPADVGLPNRLDHPNLWFHFNPQRFMTRAQANGGFDAFTDQIVAAMVQSQDVGPLVTGEGEGGSIGSKAASFLKDGIGEGLIAYGTEKAMGWILGAFGYKDPTEQALDNIENELTTMDNTLTTIQGEITTLTNQMASLIALVNLEWASLTSTMSSLNMTSDINVIQNQYNNLITEYTASSPTLCTAQGNAAAANLAAAILGSGQYDIDQHIYNIYANITGQDPGVNGGVYDLTTKLVVQIQGGQDPYDAYMALENYFGELAGIQAQGLEMMIEAIHQPLNPSDGSGTPAYPMTATQYYNKFQGQMDAEVEVFLECVDRLVAAAVDVRSEVVQQFAYVSPKTATIYSRADYVAAKLSSKQPSGLIIRLIGDPNSVSNWVTNNSIQVSGQNPTVVSVNGENINSYTATLPVSTPSGVTYYFTWTPNGNAYTFQQETNVSIVKLAYPATAAGSYAVTCPDGSQNQTLSVALYNDDFQPASSTDTSIVAYGSGVFHVRTLPTWQAGTATKTEDTSNQWGTTFTPNPAAVSMTLLSYPQELDWWLSCPITYTGDILCTIANGGKTSQTVNLNWNGAQTTTYGFNFKPNGSASANGGSQYLICQSTTQQSTANGKAMTLKDVALAPNTNTKVMYQAKQQVHSSGVAYGDDITTNAFLSSLEIVPQP